MDLKERAAYEIDLLQNEKKSQEEKLNNIDKAFFTLATSIISILTLGLTLTSNISNMDFNELINDGLFCVVLSQTFYFLNFYCIMLNRTRNTVITQIRVINDQINDRMNVIGCKPVIFRYSSISKFISLDKSTTYISYILIIGLSLVLYCCCFFTVLNSNSVNDIIKYAYEFVVVLEIINLLTLIKQWILNRYDKLAKRINDDISKYG